MDLVLDINIVLEHIDRREPFHEPSRKVCLLGVVEEANTYNTYISVNILADIFYLLRKGFGSQEAQKMIEEALSFLQPVSVTPENAKKALSERRNDFEDCLVSCCAEIIGADYIITRNVKDFRRSKVEAITPEELFARLEHRGIVYEELNW